jgi:hypothetical protein
VSAFAFVALLYVHINRIIAWLNWLKKSKRINVRMKMMKTRGAQERGVNSNVFRFLTPRQSHGKAPKRRLRLLPTSKCRVCLQRGRQQQPAHKNERRGALDAAAA